MERKLWYNNMMDYKRIFEQFKTEYTKTEDSFSFSLFPCLFEELKNYGADKSVVNEQFAKDFHEIFLSGAKPLVLFGSIEYIAHYSGLMLSAAPAQVSIPVAKVEAKKEIVKEKPKKVEVEKEQKMAISIDYDDPIPLESEEGDPLYTPPGQRINLKPEDCASAVIDWDFLKRCEAVGSKK